MPSGIEEVAVTSLLFVERRASRSTDHEPEPERAAQLFKVVLGCSMHRRSAYGTRKTNECIFSLARGLRLGHYSRQTMGRRNEFPESCSTIMDK